MPRFAVSRSPCRNQTRQRGSQESAEIEEKIAGKPVTVRHQGVNMKPSKRPNGHFLLKSTSRYDTSFTSTAWQKVLLLPAEYTRLPGECVYHRCGQLALLRLVGVCTLRCCG